jgi:hypothetical protein
MTGPRSAEERISLWLEEEAVGFLPDRVLEATFDRTRDQHQASRSGWRPFSMTRPIPAMIAVGAAAIIILSGAILLRPAPSSQVGGGQPVDFTSPRFGYTIDVPSSWNITPAAKPWPAGQRIETDQTAVDVFTIPGAPDDPEASVASQPAPVATTSTSWLSEWERIREDIGGHCFGNASGWMAATVADHPAWHIKWRCDSPKDQHSNWDEYTFLAGGKGYVITGTPSMVDTIVQSFRITSAPAGPTPAASGERSFHAGPLEPGEYTTTVFDPTLRVSLRGGWLGSGVDEPSSISIDRQDHGGTLAMARVTHVVDPTSHLEVPVGDDLVGWLIAHPAFEGMDHPTPVTIAGVTGSMMDGHAIADAEMFAEGGWTMAVGIGWHVRFYVLPLDGPDLMIIVSGMTDGSYISTMEQAQPVLDSLRIVG